MRSRGGLITKVHAVTDGLGDPLHFLLFSGNRNDICVAQALLEPFDLNGKLIPADKGYDSDICTLVGRTGRNPGVSQPYHCQTPQENRLAHVQRASSGGKPFPQAEKQPPFCHQA